MSSQVIVCDNNDCRIEDVYKICKAEYLHNTLVLGQETWYAQLYIVHSSIFDL